MKGFKITTALNNEIHFELYLQEAPITCAAFMALLPMEKIFYHARISGHEIWFDDLTPLDIIQENASVFTNPGEVVLGPAKPIRSKTKNCFGIYYGEGRGLDACNIFAKVVPQDLEKLVELGNMIWKEGAQQLKIEVL